jgi:hypothetical protein
MAASGIYSKLEQGAKTSGVSAAWFGRVKHTRKRDQLLSYLHHARNTEEHGLADSLSLKAPKLEQVPIDAKVDPTKGEHKAVLFGQNQKAAAAFKLKVQPGLQLIPVSDERYGDTFPIPGRHLGKPIPSGSVADFCELALKYLDELVAEAAALSGSKS